jgi:hypothetical protein
MEATEAAGPPPERCRSEVAAEAFDTDEMVKWIDEQMSLGPRRAGSEAGLRNEVRLERKLRELGLVNVRREAINVEHWEPQSTQLAILDFSAYPQPLDASPIPYTAFTAPGGIVAPVVIANRKSFFNFGDWRGKIVVAEIEFPKINNKLLMHLSLGKYDPDGTLPDVKHPATWVRLGWHLYRKAVQKGAIAFIGILKNQPGGSHAMWAPYGFRERDILDKPIPGLWVGRDSARALRDAAAYGMNVALTSYGVRYPSESHNIIGEIPGEGSETYVLHSHHDSPFASPVEDATGVAVVLSVAKKLQERNREGAPLKRRGIVLLTAGHFYGSIGTREAIASHGTEWQPALEVSAEHVSKELVEGRDGKLVVTERPEPQAAFIDFNRTLQRITVDSVREAGLDRTILLPAEGPLGDIPATDGGDWYEPERRKLVEARQRDRGLRRDAGPRVPLVNFIANPVDLLLAENGTRSVDVPRLPKLAAAVYGIIVKSDEVPREQLARVDQPVRLFFMRTLKWVIRMKTTMFGTRPVH